MPDKEGSKSLEEILRDRLNVIKFLTKDTNEQLLFVIDTETTLLAKIEDYNYALKEIRKLIIGSPKEEDHKENLREDNLKILKMLDEVDNQTLLNYLLEISHYANNEQNGESKSKAIEKSLKYLSMKKAHAQEILRDAEEFLELNKTDYFIKRYKAENNDGKSFEEMIAQSAEFINVMQNNLIMIEHQREYLGEELKNAEKKVVLIIPATKYPKEFIYPKDKVSNLLFIGGLSEELISLKMEAENSKKELTAKVNINIDELKNISISRNLSPYDQEVHDSIVSLYVDGGNEYITLPMIYQTMTGNPTAKLNPKQKKAISESVDRCSLTRIRIDATDEAKAYKMDKAVYEGNLLYTEKVTVQHKGNTNEYIHLLRKPVLYDYASSKNQIGRLDIKLLNTPANKNEEVIILQGYLQRRILTMKKSNLSRNIVYDTIYKY